MSELDEQVQEIREKVTEIHTAMFGASGQGGLHRWVSDIDKRVHELSRSEARVIGISIGVSTCIGVIGWAIATFMK